jgi:hypothetical protein
MNAMSAALVSICVLAGAAGCSSGDDEAANPAPSSSTAAAAVEASTPTTAATVSMSTTASANVRRLNAFRTSPGNIVCGVLDSASGSVRCDILASEVKYTPPPKPASCEFDWGNSFAIRPDRNVDPLCVSDAVEDQGNRPKAGEKVLNGQSRCTVETRSIECLAEGTDGGLFLSPDEYYTSFEE